jgi:hypothetical protein
MRNEFDVTNFLGMIPIANPYWYEENGTTSHKHSANYDCSCDSGGG